MRKKRTFKATHKQALDEQITAPESQGVRTKPRKKARNLETTTTDPGVINAEHSASILALAREQQEDEQREQAEAGLGAGAGVLASALSRLSQPAESDSDNGDGEWSVGDQELSDTEDLVVDDMETFCQEDEEAYDAFMATGDTAKVSVLADLVLSKMKSFKEGAGALVRDGQPQASTTGIDDEMMSLYEDVGKLLSRYTAGKLPKAFKVVPHLQEWEEVVFAMDPEHWSPHATYAATKMFVSQLNGRQTQRFLNLVLLNKVRDDIRARRRLHFALFQALKKAVFKPGAFYKGIILPLLKQGDCTLREAVILASVISRVSIPADHSAAALLKMAEMPYSGVTSFFMKALLDKKYALPYRVVDALVDHFISFRQEERSMPVIWHLCLLTFSQRYKHEIRSEDRERLRSLLKYQHHYGVSPEVLRELSHGHERGSAKPATSMLPVNSKIGHFGGEDAFNMAPMLLDDD